MPLQKINAHTQYEKQINLTMNISDYCQLTKTKPSDYFNTLKMENKDLHLKIQRLKNTKKIKSSTLFATPEQSETAKPLTKVITDSTQEENDKPVQNQFTVFSNQTSAAPTSVSQAINDEDTAEYDFCYDIEQEHVPQETEIKLTTYINHFKAN